MAARAVPNWDVVRSNWSWEDVLKPTFENSVKDIISLHDEHGGYDIDLVGGEDAADDLLCDVCSKLLRDPRLTVCCGKHYCETCLERWLEKQDSVNSCPQCRKTPFQHVLDKSMKRKISAIKVVCLHEEDGCDWEGELGTIETHLDSGSGCGYIPISCPNHCKSILNRMSIQVHLTSECELREYKCEHCGLNTRYNKITEHYESCDEFPMPCLKECGELVKRKHLAAHKHRCEMEDVECPFMCVGCYTPVMKKDFEEHLKQETHTHLSYFMDPFTTLKSSVSTLTTNVNELCAHQMEDRRKIDELQRRLVLAMESLHVQALKQESNWYYMKVGLFVLLVLLVFTFIAN